MRTHRIAAISDDVTRWGLRLAICQGFDQYADVRPACCRASPDRVSRIMRFAFALAMTRPRRHVTVVTKSNAQRHGMVLWDEIAAEVAREFPEVTTDRDAGRRDGGADGDRPGEPRRGGGDEPPRRHPQRPWRGDRRLARDRPDGEPEPERRFPSMFEPIRGAAFDLTGRGIANPIGTFWSAAMMLDHLGEADAAARLMRAIEQVTAAGAPLTPDLGGSATTEAVTKAVCEAVRGANV